MADLMLLGLLTEAFVEKVDECIYGLMKQEIEHGITYHGQALLHFLNENSKHSVERYKEKMKSSDTKAVK